MKKYFNLIIVFLVFVLVLLGCENTQEVSINLEGRTIAVDMETPDDNSTMGRRLEEVADKYNVSFNTYQIHGWGRHPQIVEGLKEGEPPFDIIEMPSNSMYSLYAQDLLYPLNDYMDSNYFEDLPEYLKVLEDFVKTDGEFFALPKEPSFMSSYLVFYNKDILEQSGFPDLWDLYQDSSWDLDMMVEVAKKTSLDDNDVIGANLMNLQPLLIHGLFGVELFDTLEDGSIIPNYTNENHLKALEYYIELLPYSEFNRDNENVTMYVEQLNHIKEIDDNIGFVPFPKISNEGENTIILQNCQLVAIPITEENPEALVSIAQEIYNPEEDYELLMHELEQVINDDNKFAVLKELIDNQRIVNQADRKNDVLFYLENNKEANYIFNELYMGKISEIEAGELDIRDAMNELQLEVEGIFID